MQLFVGVEERILILDDSTDDSQRFGVSGSETCTRSLEHRTQQWIYTHTTPDTVVLEVVFPS